MIAWTCIGFWKTLNRISKPQLKNLGLYELKQHKPWFHEECSRFSDPRKQTKMQWLRFPNQNNVDTLNNVRREACKLLRDKKKEYLKINIDGLGTYSMIKNIRSLYGGINDFKKGYHRRTNKVKDEKGDLFTESHGIVARWRNHFSQLLNVQYIGLVMLGRQNYLQQNH